MIFWKEKFQFMINVSIYHMKKNKKIIDKYDTRRTNKTF